MILRMIVGAALDGDGGGLRLMGLDCRGVVGFVMVVTIVVGVGGVTLRALAMASIWAVRWPMAPSSVAMRACSWAVSVACALLVLVVLVVVMV